MIKRCISSALALPVPWSFGLWCSFLQDKWRLIHVTHAISFSFPSLPSTLDLKVSSARTMKRIGFSKADLSVDSFPVLPSGWWGFVSARPAPVGCSEGSSAPPYLIFPHPHWWFCLQCMGCGRNGLHGACAQSRVAVALGPGAGSVWYPSMEARAVEGPRCKPNSAI